MRVIGVDINPAATEEAWSNAVKAGVKDRVHFEPADILQDHHFGNFDVVLLIRFLTCFGDAIEWQSVLERALAHVRPDGLIYIHDFLVSPHSENYRSRYEAAQRLGWRTGNFAVNDSEGQLVFIAHHHSEEDLEQIARPYEKVFYQVHESLSMNGNLVRMFEFIGRKRE